MTTKTTYIAFDGKEFSISSECEDYEKSLLAAQMGNFIIAYDYKGEKIDCMKGFDAFLQIFILAKS